MKFSLAIAIFATVISQLTGVKVTVFYESLCPDSINFITRQLKPNYDSLKEFITLDFVPFGKASFTTDPWSITCQHGPRECVGNIMQACALNEYQDNNENLVLFVECVMGANKPDTAGEECANKLGLPFGGVKNCTDTDQGKELIQVYGNRTLQFEPRITFVPTVVYDDVYSADDEDESLSDFKSVVCKKIEGNKPSACSNK